MKTKTRQIDLRMSNELIARVWKRVDVMNQELPGHRFTFADVVRILLTEGLDRVETNPRKPKQ